MLPTVRQLRARAQRDRHAAKLNALRYILCGRRGSTEQNAPSVVRFLDLSDDANALPETMNRLFTIGLERKSVGEGKIVSVSVELVGSCTITKKQRTNH